MKHPNQTDLAAFAGNEVSFFQRLAVERHVRRCEQCEVDVADFRAMRSELASVPMPDLDWNAVASEMRANIHLGLEAGACVADLPVNRPFGPRLAVAFASLLLLAGAGLLIRDHRPALSAAGTNTAPLPTSDRTPVVESSVTGIELHSGPASFALLNRDGGGATLQTVSAQGAVRSRDIDGDTGSVTIKDVYLQ